MPAMMRDLLHLTWLELKIFLREPLGAIGSLLLPVFVFILLGRLVGGRTRPEAIESSSFLRVGLPLFTVVLIVLGAVLSLVTIISIYREGGILKRLRATPLRPITILTAQVLVKLLLTSTSLVGMVLAGRRFYPVGMEPPLFSFGLALAISSVSLMSLGFLIASIVPTARFAQPMGSLILYPMVAISGLFVPLDSMPGVAQAIAHALPLTYAVSLLRGIWLHEAWSNHLTDIAALAGFFLLFTAISSRVFRWE
jgi:ABC-2 type transport system permease protein